MDGSLHHVAPWVDDLPVPVHSLGRRLEHRGTTRLVVDGHTFLIDEQGFEGELIGA